MRKPKTVTLASDGLGLAAVLALVVAAVAVGYLVRGYPFSLAAPVGFVLFRFLGWRITRLGGVATTEREEESDPRRWRHVEKRPGGAGSGGNLVEFQDALRCGHQQLSQTARDDRASDAREGGALEKSRLVQLRVATLIGVRNAVTSVAVGVGLVGAVQAVVWFLDEESRQALLGPYQMSLIKAKDALEAISGIKVLLILSVALVALTVCLPRLRLMERFLGLRKVMGAALVAVTAASAFTFATAGAVALKREDWERSERLFVKGQRARLEDLRREIREDALQVAAAELLARSLAQADTEQKAAIVRALKEASRADAMAAGRSVVRRSKPGSDHKGHEEANSARVGADAPAKAGSGPEELKHRLDENFDVEATSGRALRATVSATELEAQRARATRRASEQGLAECVSSLLSEAWPAGDITKAFAEGAIGAVVELALRESREPLGQALTKALAWLKSSEPRSLLEPLRASEEARVAKRGQEVEVERERRVDPPMTEAGRRWGPKRRPEKGSPEPVPVGDQSAGYGHRVTPAETKERLDRLRERKKAPRSKERLVP